MGGELVDARQSGVPTSSVDTDSSGLSRADVERALARFAEAAASNPTKPPRISPELEGVLEEISATGVPYYAWGILKELLAARMEDVVGALEKETGFRQASGGKTYIQRRDELLASLRSFDAAPFTLQRLAEVLQDPRRQYTSTHKLINGLERLLMVSSTLPICRRKGSVRALDNRAPHQHGQNEDATSLSSRRLKPANGVASNGSMDCERDANAATSSTTGVVSHANGGSALVDEVGMAGQKRVGSFKSGSAEVVAVKAEAADVIPEDPAALGSQPTTRDNFELMSGGAGSSDGGGSNSPGRKRLKVEVLAESSLTSD